MKRNSCSLHARILDARYSFLFRFFFPEDSVFILTLMTLSFMFCPDNPLLVSRPLWRPP